MNERRRGRLAAFLESELPHFFREEVEFPPNTFISIMHIEIKQSGQSAGVLVSVFPDTSTKRVAEILKKSENKATHFIRARLRTKYSPVIRFHVCS